MISWLKRNTPRKLREHWWRFKMLPPQLGTWSGWLVYKFGSTRLRSRGATYQIHPRHATHPLFFRQGSSDPDVLEGIFIDLQYDQLCDNSDVQLVIDCGANVGYTSAFFLTQFPSCHVIAVEPDAGNFAMLQKNLLPYGKRATAVRAGIWSDNTPLVVSKTGYRDEREWAIQVRPCEPNEQADLQGVGIESLLASSGFSRISLLKIDIEGAEAVLFSKNTDWLDKVDVMAIELHDDSQFGKATEVFYSAMEGRGFEFSHQGELTICRRPGLPIRSN
jgi:FkbM family methyltransferase